MRASRIVVATLVAALASPFASPVTSVSVTINGATNTLRQGDD